MPIPRSGPSAAGRSSLARDRLTPARPSLRSDTLALVARLLALAAHRGEDALAGALAEEARLAAVFHDIGKIAVPESILNKPGPLTPTSAE
jgi:HD-GYP domain-containing protein (c-di-GMP phosphodiesterase class II)